VSAGDILCRERIEREDIAHIVHHLRERDRREMFALRWDDNEEHLTDAIFAVAGPMWRLWCWRDEPVALSGIIPQRPGVVMAGAFGTERFPRVARAILSWGRRWVIPRLQAAQYHRGEAYALAANIDGQRFIEAMGGRKEAYLHKYGRDREDFVLFVWRLDEDTY